MNARQHLDMGKISRHCEYVHINIHVMTFVVFLVAFDVGPSGQPHLNAIMLIIPTHVVINGIDHCHSAAQAQVALPISALLPSIAAWHGWGHLIWF